MGSDKSGFELLDILTLLSFWLQIENYQEIKAQASTDDIFTELQRQDRQYLDKIIENQEKILAKLAALTAD